MSTANPLYRGRHITSALDFDRPTLEALFALTAAVKKIYADGAGRQRLRSVLLRDEGPFRCRILVGGESTRTSSSFEDAIEALGGTVRKDVLQFSSVAKGETLHSTARILGPRCDVIVIRADNEPGAARKMADAVEDYRLKTVIINAGDGTKEHPTQMLLDLFTIQERSPDPFERGHLTYMLVGDLSHSRTIHSLLLGLKHYGGKVFLVGPPDESIPGWLKKELALAPRLSLTEINSKEKMFSWAPSVNVWYFTRLQKNLRSERPSEKYENWYAAEFGATEELRSRMREDCIALHPLPHGEEYPEGIDLIDRRFIHFDQADNGFYVRMALLIMLFSPRTFQVFLGAA